MLVAVRTHDGNLEVILWELDDNGQCTRLDDEQAWAIKQVRLAAVGDGFAVTAVRQSDDTMQLIVWYAAPDGMLHRYGDATAGRARDLKIAAISNGAGVALGAAIRAGPVT